MGNSCITSNYNKNGFLPGGADSSLYWFWKSDQPPVSESSEVSPRNSEITNKKKHDKDSAMITLVSPPKPPDTISIMKPPQSDNAMIKPPDTISIMKPPQSENAMIKPSDTIDVTKPSPIVSRNMQEEQAVKTGDKPFVSPVKSLTSSVLGRKTENLKEIYVLGRKLGQGQFGTTFLCTEKSTGKEYACKSIAKRKIVCQEDVDDVVREIQIMHHLSGHPNIVTIKGAYEDMFSVHLVMELCTGGELFNRIVQRGHYSERKAAELTRTIVGVVEACHSLGVMHRDLKPENFLFSDKKEDSPLKTIDFGLSVFFKPGTFNIYIYIYIYIYVHANTYHMCLGGWGSLEENALYHLHSRPI